MEKVKAVVSWVLSKAKEAGLWVWAKVKAFGAWVFGWFKVGVKKADEKLQGM